MLFPTARAVEVALLTLIVVGLAVSIAKGRRAGVFLARDGSDLRRVGDRAARRASCGTPGCLPFLYLSRYLLAAIGVAELGLGHRPGWCGPASATATAGPRCCGRRCVALASVVTLGLGLRDLPCGPTRGRGSPQ